MTVTFKGETPGSRSGKNALGVRTYSRSYTLESDSRLDGEALVMSNPNLPVIGSLHPEDGYAWCRSLTVACLDGFKHWQVTAEYSSEGKSKSENPLDDEAKITWDSEQYQAPFIIDRDGKGVMNSAGDPFDPPLMKDFTRPTVQIVKPLESVPSWIMTYYDRVNESAFNLDGLAIGAELAKIQKIAVGPVESRNDVFFRTVTIVMHLNADGWNSKPMDRGFRELNDDDEPVAIGNYGDQGPPTDPVLLDGSGKAIVPKPEPADAVFLDFKTYATADFSVLPLT